MDQSSLLHSRSYQCRILDRDLKVVRTVGFESPSDAEATETAAELLRRQDNGAVLAGFELWQGDRRLLVRLESTETESPANILTPTPQRRAG